MTSEYDPRTSDADHDETLGNADQDRVWELIRVYRPDVTGWYPATGALIPGMSGRGRPTGAGPRDRHPSNVTSPRLDRPSSRQEDAQPSEGHDVDEYPQHITVTERQVSRDAVLVAVAGDLDRDTAATFRRRVAEIIDVHPQHRLDLDLSAVEFCDLAGLRALHALDRTDSEGRQLARITTAGPCLNLLLALCRVSTVLGYVPPPTRRDAN